MTESLGIDIGITQVEYSNTGAGPILHLFGRTPLGSLIRIDVKNFIPYFYVDEEDIQRIEYIHGKKITIDPDTPYKTLRGTTAKRVYTKKPGDVRIYREGFNHYEADIIFTERFLIDNNIKYGVTAPNISINYFDLKPIEIDAPARVCMIDIECNDERGFPTPDRDEIICITVWDSFEDKYTTLLYEPQNGKKILSCNLNAQESKVCYDNTKHALHIYNTEYDMLAGLIGWFRQVDPDIITGWNTTNFDIPYIQNRMKFIGLRPDNLGRLSGPTNPEKIRGRVVFDLLAAYRKLQAKALESYRLDAVAFEELGERKIHVSGGVAPLWRNEPDKLVEYNVKDVELCIGIDKKNNIIDFYREIAKYVGCHMERTLASSLVVDTYVLRKAHGKYILPSKNYAAEGEEFEGATVFEPSSGVFENVVVFDLKSLYPMSMMTLNASMETKDSRGENVAPNGVRFKKEPDGITRELISDLLKQRDEKKRLRNTYPHGSREYEVLDMQQNVIKVIMNTYYGVSGFPKFRLYDRDIGSAVTATGRAIIEFTKDVASKHNLYVMYGDTDSIICVLNPQPKNMEELISRSKEVEKILNESYDEFAKRVLNVDKHYFSTKFEKVYKRFFQAGKKKRYAGHLVWKEGIYADKIDIVGFETRRSDTPPVVKEILTTVLEMIIKGEPETNVQIYLREIVKKYRRGDYPLEQIGIPSGISKKFDEYKNNDIRVRASEYSNKNLGTNFTAGSKPKRIYIKYIVDRKYPNTDVIAFEFSEQVPKEFVIDYETMLNKTLRDPIMRIIEPLGWTWTDMDPSRTSLAQFGIDI